MQKQKEVKQAVGRIRQTIKRKSTIQRADSKIDAILGEIEPSQEDKKDSDEPLFAMLELEVDNEIDMLLKD